MKHFIKQEFSYQGLLLPRKDSLHVPVLQMNPSQQLSNAFASHLPFLCTQPNIEHN